MFTRNLSVRLRTACLLNVRVTSLIARAVRGRFLQTPGSTTEEAGKLGLTRERDLVRGTPSRDGSGRWDGVASVVRCVLSAAGGNFFYFVF